MRHFMIYETASKIFRKNCHMMYLKKKMRVKNIIAQSFHEKEIRNSADNRKSLLIIKNWFCSKPERPFRCQYSDITP